MRSSRAFLVAAAAATFAFGAGSTAVAAPAKVRLSGPATAKRGVPAHFTVTATGRVAVAAFEARVLVDGRAMRLAGASVLATRGARALGPNPTGQGLHLGFYGASARGA